MLQQNLFVHVFSVNYYGIMLHKAKSYSPTKGIPIQYVMWTPIYKKKKEAKSYSRWHISNNL